MKYPWLIATVCLTGCLANNSLEYDSVSQNNLYHIAKVRKGMNEREVLYIMRQPYSYETFEIGEDIYDVWFYVTQTTVLDQSRMVPRNLTPLTFKNGILVGTGYDYYYYVTRENAKQVQKESAPAPKEDKTEDTEFEKALKKSVEVPNRNPAQEIPMTPQKTPANPPAQTSFASPLASKFAAKQKVLAKVKKGMTQNQVKGTIGKPERTENFQLGEDSYDVWFYYPNQSNEMVPLTFKNGILVGLTIDYYNGVREAAGQEPVDGYNRSAEQMLDNESDQNFNYW